MMNEVLLYTVAQKSQKSIVVVHIHHAADSLKEVGNEPVSKFE